MQRAVSSDDVNLLSSLNCSNLLQQRDGPKAFIKAAVYLRTSIDQ